MDRFQTGNGTRVQENNAMTDTYRIARRHVDCFADCFADGSDELMKRHHEAMEAYDCDAWLKIGVVAFETLVHADRRTLELVTQGDEEIGNYRNELEPLYQRWLETAHRGEDWISVQHERGYRLDNLDEFRRCCEEADEIIQRRTMKQLGRSALSKAFDKEPW